MATYKNEAVVNYNVEKVFKLFYKTAKRDFKKFKEETAVGTNTGRQVGAYSGKKEHMQIEITAYEKNKVYEITSYKRGVSFISRYELEKVDEDKTKLKHIESDDTKGIFGLINNLLAILFLRRKAKKRFDIFIKGMNSQLERSYGNVKK